MVHIFIDVIRLFIFCRHVAGECRRISEFPMVFYTINNQFINLPILWHKRIVMRTEITDIQKWVREYNNPTSDIRWAKAKSELEKVHNKYGTIDTSIIKSLIN